MASQRPSSPTAADGIRSHGSPLHHHPGRRSLFGPYLSVQRMCFLRRLVWAAPASPQRTSWPEHRSLLMFACAYWKLVQSVRLPVAIHGDELAKVRIPKQAHRFNHLEPRWPISGTKLTHEA
ncbi:hypothetical protein CCHR01_02849 [Colletotrichum chrysophilum]|uniref:Uncharacterized protein n=1 Tax=Colletotrichum chrysophilum TaxID=1836956 RepID=A0AAD9AW36_9PEZI|nr:hypothetical protein CCHR01_02849 [Colletotrichum chrysophilum]